LLAAPVRFVDDCIGEAVAQAVGEMSAGDVILLQNTRYYAGEESKDEAEMLAFAEQLAAPADMYVNDAFGTCHRKHASTYGVTKYLRPSVAGLLVEEEVDKLSRLLDAPQEGFVAILGGAKIEDKIGVVKRCQGSATASRTTADRWGHGLGVLQGARHGNWRVIMCR